MNDRIPHPSIERDRTAWPNLRPRNAATLIIVDTRGPAPRVLMGRRHHGHLFMPGKFVFPGGRIDPSDYRVSPAAGLHPDVEGKLLVDMKRGPSRRRAAALALAALRETFEEAGLLIGAPSPVTGMAATAEGLAWRAFLAEGVAPDLSRLILVARAITPPRQARRYDTRFFCVDADQIAASARPRDAELVDRRWLTVAEAQELDLANITRAVLNQLADQLKTAPNLRPLDRVPYYYARHGVLHSELI